MKKVISLLSLLLALAIAENSEAALYDRGNGMIYDNVLKITWLQDANYAMTSGYDNDGLMDWNKALSWAGQLSFGGFNDWRLPMVLPVDGQAFITGSGFDGSTDFGYNITRPTSELMYMYYVNLGNPGAYFLDGRFNRTNLGKFQHWCFY